MWAQVKQEVAENNETFTMVEVERLMNEELDRVTCRKFSRGRLCKRRQTGRNFRARPENIQLSETEDEESYVTAAGVRGQV
jgi:hypothetical protein